MKSEHIFMGEYRKAGGFGGNRGGGFGGGRPSFGGGRPSFNRGGNRDGGSREMFPATCSSCHKACEIPFRPSGDRPVYCRDCFGSQEGSTPDTRGRRDERGGEARFVRKEHTPSFSTPKAPVEDKRIEGLKRQLDDVNVKVDQILHLLNAKNAVVLPAEVKAAAKKSVAEAVQAVVEKKETDTKTKKKSVKKEDTKKEAVAPKKVVKKKVTTKKA
jgi:CxxC-x17-CxxC domain-containing protein